MNARHCVVVVGWVVLAATATGAAGGVATVDGSPTGGPTGSAVATSSAGPVAAQTGATATPSGVATGVVGGAEATGVVGDAEATDVAGSEAATAAAVPETDSTVTRIRVAANGSATWEVQVRTRLTTDEQVAEYEAFQAEFEENTSQFLGPFRERIRGVVADARNATGRPMEARGFSAETSIQTVPRRWGVVTYEFRWVHFAAHDGQALVVGDVFGGQFFLTENDTLAVVAPEGYAVAATDPPPAEQEDGVVRWFGRQSFPDDTPAVRFVPAASTTAGPGTTADGPGAGTQGPDGTAGGTASPDSGPGPNSGAGTTAPPADSGGGSLPLAAGVLVVGLLAIGAYRYVTGGRIGRAPDVPPPDDGGPAGGAADGTAGQPDGASGAAGGESGATDTPAAGDGQSAGEAPAGPAVGAAASDGSAGSGEDALLTDADRVEAVLEEAGGQLRQTEIVEAFDWSKSKTSRVLSDMADEGRVEKLRIGRENVIRLPEEADDPFGGRDDAGGADDASESDGGTDD